MKRPVYAIAIFFMAALFLPVSALADGIRTAADFVEFATALNAGQPTEKWRNEKGEVCLEADIDMAKVKKFESISSFGGVFDGQGHSILNWKATSGLFNKLLQGGVIRNLIIDKSCSMKAENKAEEYFLGFIANCNNGLVENCENYGSISHKSKYSDTSIDIGGVVGSNRWLVINCNNYGDITSNCVSTLQKAGVTISIGGVVGGGYTKMEPKPNISWCHNYGKLTYSGDFPVVNVAGVVGSCERFMTIKYCVNRGNIDVIANCPEGDWKIRNAYVGGITGYTQGHVAGSDNFGKINLASTHKVAFGGIVAQSDGGLLVSDCVNYSNLALSNLAAHTTDMGGIIGRSTTTIHVNNCENHGSVTYDGYSPEAPCYIGGIVGQMHMKWKLKHGAYFRNCVNHGMVFSGTGGNNHENDKSIMTGGIAGFVKGHAHCPVTIKDCLNKGEVSSVGGKRNPVAPIALNTKVTGSYCSTYAQSAEPMTDGSNVFGKVVTTDGKPLEEVVVSDGLQCVTTDAEGNYRMKSNLKDVRFVMVSPPSGYEAEPMYSMPQLFRRVRRYEKAVTADFTLKPTGPKDEYTMIMIGDPQIRGLGWDNSGERYRDVVIPDINQLKGDNENFYSIVVGDLVYNWMTGYDDYIDVVSTAKFPMYNVIGNHDMEQENLYDTRLATPYYENYLGPVWYSFNIGKVHYVMLNTITADYKAPNTRNYWYGLTHEQFEWLKNDLSHVPKDMTLVVCAHGLLFQNNWTYRGVRNIDGLKVELAKFEKVYAWAGHSHYNYGCEYKWDGGKLVSATVSRCSGDLRVNNEMMNNGTPNGYVVVKVKGGDVTWQFKCVGKDTDCQMNAYTPLRTKDEYVKANIWNWMPDFWTVPEWWENGVKVADMENIKDFDVYYQERYTAWKEQKDSNEKWGEPSQTGQMFRVKPSEGVRKGEIRVTDYFGVTYIQTIEW